MERLEHYRQCIRKLLTEHATLFNSNLDIECQLLFDAERDHYQLLDVGWEGLKRVYNCFLHFRAVSMSKATLYRVRISLEAVFNTSPA